MSTHTPGPWSEWHNDKGAFVINDKSGVAVLCQRNDWDHRAAESVANARLIAAAPDMFAALQHARTCVPYPSDVHNKIVNAILKADGST